MVILHFSLKTAYYAEVWHVVGGHILYKDEEWRRPPPNALTSCCFEDVISKF
jgi:hypothetical protein